MIQSRWYSLMLGSLLWSSAHVQGFSLTTPFSRPNSILASSPDTWNGDGVGRLEQIEFKIYSDGRVEETVRGIKGNNCHKVTESINKALGEVVASQPTEEMYEQELTIDTTLYNTESSSSSNSAEWDGRSSW